MTHLVSERRFAIVLFGLCLLANLWFSHVGWDHSLIEAHDSRQAQTALTASPLGPRRLATCLPLAGLRPALVRTDGVSDLPAHGRPPHPPDRPDTNIL